MITHILQVKIYHIAQKLPQLFCAISLSQFFYRTTKTLFKSINYSLNQDSFLLKNTLIPIRVLK